VRRGWSASSTTPSRSNRVECLRHAPSPAPADVDQFRAGPIGLPGGHWSPPRQILMAEAEAAAAGGRPLGVHLRMDGNFLAGSTPRPCRHTGALMERQAGIAPSSVAASPRWVHPRQACLQRDGGCRKLGPNTFKLRLQSAYCSQNFNRLVQPINAPLLDQALVAGVGKHLRR